MKRQPLSPPAPRLLRSIQPFAVVLETIVVPEALRIGREEPDPKELARIARRIDQEVFRGLGYRLHRAIIVHGLKVTCHCYHEAGQRRRTRRVRGEQLEAIDVAYCLIRRLEDHYGVYNLNLRLS